MRGCVSYQDVLIRVRRNKSAPVRDADQGYKMTSKSVFLSAAAATCACAAAVPGQAATHVYSFTQAAASAGLGAGPYGSVTVTENAGALDFVMTLAAGYRIHRGNANHNAFTFSLSGDPAVTVTGLPTGFSAVGLSAGSDVNAPPFGAGYTGIKCAAPACGPGWNGGYSGPLSFKVMTSGTALTLNSLISRVNNDYAVHFTSDIVVANGNTGNVGSVMMHGAVPEPSAWALMIIGFGAAGAAMRRARASGLRLAA